MSSRPLFACLLSASLLASLAGCQPSADQSESNFFVTSAGHAGMSGYLPTGYGWQPNSQLDISIWHEPTGPGSVSSEWKKVLDVTVDASSMFGFDSGAAFYPVRRSICGNPEPGQMVLFMAKSKTTGKIRMRETPADLYFTFQPCG
jgi:hypothetical protein